MSDRWLWSCADHGHLRSGPGLSEFPLPLVRIADAIAVIADAALPESVLGDLGRIRAGSLERHFLAEHGRCRDVRVVSLQGHWFHGLPAHPRGGIVIVHGANLPAGIAWVPEPTPTDRWRGRMRMPKRSASS